MSAHQSGANPRRLRRTDQERATPPAESLEQRRARVRAELAALAAERVAMGLPATGMSEADLERATPAQRVALGMAEAASLRRYQRSDSPADRRAWVLARRAAQVAARSVEGRDASGRRSA